MEDINEWCAPRESAIHAQGLFARKAIPGGTRILEYRGERIGKEESERRATQWEQQARQRAAGLVYIFELDDEWDLDGNREDNLARLINHSCDENCEAVNEDGRIWIFARRAIAEGEELTFDYAYDIEHFLDHPCRCGADNCCGYIVRKDLRRKLRRLLKNRGRTVQERSRERAARAAEESARLAR